MAHRLETRVRKLEAAKPDTSFDYLEPLSDDELSRAMHLSVKRDAAGLSAAEAEELAGLDKLEVFGVDGAVDEPMQRLIDQWAVRHPECRPFAREPVWLQDRNHVFDVVGRLALQASKLKLSKAEQKKIGSLVKRLSHRYIWGYEPAFTEQEINTLANGLRDKDLGEYSPWMAEYLSAHASLL